MQYTEDFCNNEYNPRLRVPEHERERVTQGWQQKSERARCEWPCQVDVRYGAGEGETLDIFPATMPGAPSLVFIHGGYWRVLDKSDFSFLAPPLVRAGAAVFIPNYALAPKVTVEHIVHQVLAATFWIYRNAAAYGGDPERLVVTGHSAGAHMTAVMMAATWPTWPGAPGPRVVKRGLAVSGVYDLAPLVHASFLNNDLRLDMNRAAALSPIYMPPAPHARLWTSVGGAESGEFHRQNALIGERWADVLAGDIPMPGCNHFDIVDEMANPASALFAGILELLDLPGGTASRKGPSSS